ncbi:MAG: DUF3800 domain-containing protein [Candidatus Omnitrophica bacterium]|nr:DUF3800 domain-containing protein [Candidatus Omnitrophota bacterium]
MKIMFLDESGDHSLEKIDATYPVFVLAGCIFNFDYYTAIVEPAVQELKQKHFSKDSIILRSYDIRKQKNAFASLVDKRKREAFYLDLNEMLLNLDFTIIAAAINKTVLKNQYAEPDNPYHLCFRFILERSIMYLGRQKEQMMLRIESRETHNDRKLAQEYESFREGSERFSKEEVHAKLADLSFNQKSQNIAGMQIADLVAYPIGKWAMDQKRENAAFEVLRTKIHAKEGKCLGYGLKTFP